MKRLLPYFILLFLLSSCFVKKKTTYGKERKITVEASDEDRVTEVDSTAAEKPTSGLPSSKANDIINTALSYSGVRYKYGGTTSKG
ncbi:MAG: NlpC/P60 family protein, partial [Maribacter sp.]|nr:NlpC/P60 family protein [Maribacter sp.]